MKIALKLTVVAVALLLAMVAAAQAEEPCSLKTMEGTYAISARGSSLMLDPASQPYPLHWSGAVAPFAQVGEITFGPDGEGSGFHWIWLGSLSGGVDPIPLQATITQMNDDCTGLVRYSWNLPGMPDIIVVERIIVFDNGREFRSLPTDTQNSIPTLSFIGTGERLHRPAEVVPSCGPQTAYGEYLLTAENIVPRGTLLADFVMIRMNVARNGDYTATMYEKLGAQTIKIPVSGTISVNADCSFSGMLFVPAVNGAFVIKGVYLDEGKRAYGMNLYNINKPPDQQGMKYSLAEMIRIGK